MSMITFHKTLIILVYIFSCNGLEILTPSDLAGRKLSSPSVRLNDKWEPFTADVVIANPFDACSNFQINVTNRVVLLSNIQGSCSLRRKLQLVQSSGALGAIVEAFGQDAGKGVIAYMYKNLDDLQLHAVEIKPDAQFRDAVRQNDVSVIFSADPNSYTALIDSGAIIAFSVIFSVVSFGVLSLASYKLFLFLKEEGWRFMPPQMCLTIEIISGIFRFIFFAVDPMYTRRALPSAFTGFLLRLPFLSSLLTSFLITFYWHIVLKSYKKTNMVANISTVKLPLLIIGIGMTIFHFTLDALHESNVASLIIVYTAFFIIMMISISIFFFVTSYRVMKIFSHNEAQQSGGSSARRTAMTRMTRFVIISGIGMLCYVLSGIIYASPAYSTIGMIYFTWWLIYTSIFTISISQILIFQAPNQRFSASNSVTSHQISKNASTHDPLSGSIEISTI